MKKSVLLLITAILVNMLVFAVNAEEDAVLSEDQSMLIQALGIDGYTPDNPNEITRGEWTQLLSTAVFGDDGGYVSEEQVFSDMDENSRFYDEISLLYGADIIKGYLNGNFGADDSLTVDQALTTVMRVMYKNVDYSSFIGEKKNKLLKNTKISDSNSVSLNNAYIIICNMMNEQVYTADSNKPYLFMEYRRGLYKVKGIVTDDGNNSLTGASIYKNNEIIIDEKMYTNCTNEKDLFGYYITGYYYDDGEATLVSLSKTNRNNELFIYSDDIEEYDTATRTYRYYSDSDKAISKKVTIGTDIITVFNGRNLGINDTSFRPESYKPKNGFVKLLDNNGNGKYDIVFVYDYKTGIVTANDAENEKIYFKLESEPLDLSDTEYMVYDENGNVISTDSIGKDTVISYAVSADGEIARIIAVNNITEDICQSVNYIDKIIKTKTGGEYSVSDYLIDNNTQEVKTGKKYSFYFDGFNKVVYIEALEDNTWSVAYISKVIKEEDEEAYYAKLIGFGEKETTYTLSERVSLYKQDKTYKKVKSEQAYIYLDNYISEAYSKFDGFSTLIRYKTDIDGDINTIELPIWPEYDLSDAGEDRMCVILNSAKTKITYQYSGHFMGQCAIGTGTSAMMLSKEDTESVGLKMADFVHNQSYKIIAYSTTPGSLMADYIFLPAGDKNELNFTYTYFAVSEINDVYDEEDGEVTELKGWKVTSSERVETTFKIKDSSVLENVKDFAGNTYSVSSGDILYISLSSKKDSINGLYMIYDADGKNAEGKGTMGDSHGLLAGAVQPYYTGVLQYGNPYGFTVNSNTQAITVGNGEYKVSNRIFLGYVYDVEDSAIKVTTQPLGTNTTYKFNYDRNKYFTEILPGLSSKIIKIENNGRKTMISQANLGDLKSYTDYSGGCSKVLLIQREWSTMGVFIIEE